MLFCCCKALAVSSHWDVGTGDDTLGCFSEVDIFRVGRNGDELLPIEDDDELRVIIGRFSVSCDELDWIVVNGDDEFIVVLLF